MYPLKVKILSDHLLVARKTWRTAWAIRRGRVDRHETAKNHLQLLLAHGADQVLQIVSLQAGKLGTKHIGQVACCRATAASLASARSRRRGRSWWRRVVQIVVDFLPQLVVLFDKKCEICIRDFEIYLDNNIILNVFSEMNSSNQSLDSIKPRSI